MAADDEAVSGVLETIQTLDAESAVKEAEHLATMCKREKYS